MKWLAMKFIAWTKPLVWRFAEAYDLRVDRPLHAHGQNALIIEDDAEKARHNIPKSAYFNTRSGTITVGKNTVFGEHVQVLTGKHLNSLEAAKSGVALHHVPPSGRDIAIGRDCYIGSCAILIGPLTVGEGAVIGAGAIVTQNVPAYAFVAGKKAEVVKLLIGADGSPKPIKHAG